MNTDIVSIDDAAIEELLEKTLDQESNEPESLLPEPSLPASRRFGLVDLWHIRNRKRHFSIYRNS